ncbi:MAG: hypothetical protein EAZ89_01060 [Bacteroidetes bacterium]|nr:MAG: hypothetical protein EAZ89_01060 [Bacteroidota bacterium]
MKPVKVTQKASPKTSLERKTAQFQKLIKEIDSLKDSLQALQKELEAGRKCYFDTIAPLHKDQQQVSYDTGLRIAYWLERGSFTKKEKEVLTFMLLDIMESLLSSDFFRGKPDLAENAERIYDTYAPQTWKQGKAASDSAQIDEARMLFEMLGMDVPISEDDDPDTVVAKAAQFLQNQQEEEAAKEELRKARKKSDKQLAKEEKAKTQEQIVYRSLKSIYYNLVKLLHPDLEPDEVIRAEKNTAIQQINSAYESKDLYALLRFQAEYLQSHTGEITQLPENQLVVYINILKSQKEALLMEKDMFFLSSPYDAWIYENLCSENGNGGEAIRKAYIRNEKDVLKTYRERYTAISSLESLGHFIKDLRVSYDDEGEAFIEVVGKRASGRKKR